MKRAIKAGAIAAAGALAAVTMTACEPTVVTLNAYIGTTWAANEYNDLDYDYESNGAGENCFFEVLESSSGVVILAAKKVLNAGVGSSSQRFYGGSMQPGEYKIQLHCGGTYSNQQTIKVTAPVPPTPTPTPVPPAVWNVTVSTASTTDTIANVEIVGSTSTQACEATVSCTGTTVKGQPVAVGINNPAGSGKTLAGTCPGEGSFVIPPGHYERRSSCFTFTPSANTTISVDIS